MDAYYLSISELRLALDIVSQMSVFTSKNNNLSYSMTWLKKPFQVSCDVTERNRIKN